MWIDPSSLRNHGIAVMEIDVRAGQAVWISCDVPHMVMNTETPTIAWTWNILLPETLHKSYERFHIN